jgi:hypothetical protein
MIKVGITLSLAAGEGARAPSGEVEWFKRKTLLKGDAAGEGARAPSNPRDPVRAMTRSRASQEAMHTYLSFTLLRSINRSCPAKLQTRKQFVPA